MKLVLDTENKEEDILDAEANYFAILLLMPERHVRKWWRYTHDIDDLAKIFGVPTDIIFIRLKDLRLIGD